MSAISSVSPSTTASAIGTDPTAASRLPQKTLGQNDFLKLLAKQFQTQDPMKPMDDTQFIAQMAQFTALQQTGSMAQTMAAIRADQQNATANSYLGHRVTVDTGDSQTDSGDVTAIAMHNGEPQLLINGNAYPLSAVLRVEPGAVSAPPITAGP